MQVTHFYTDHNEKSSDFPEKTSRLRVPWKTVQTLRRFVIKTVDFLTDKPFRNVSKAKQLSEQYCKLSLVKFDC